MLIALSHGRKGPSGGAGSQANIRVDINDNPLDFRSAMEQDHTNWHPAVLTEISSLLEANCFEFTILPLGKTAIGCRWVFKRKIEAVPTVSDRVETIPVSNPAQSASATACQNPSTTSEVRTRYKARLVAKGYEQRYNIDYGATFSPTPRLTTFRMLISLAAYFGWDIHQLDVTTAFLNAKLEDVDVYMQIPEGMEDMASQWMAKWGITDPSERGRVSLKLLRSLYGLKQSPHEWNKDIDGKLKTLGFRQCDADSNLYIPAFKDGCFLLLYVDDILLVGPSHNIAIVKKMIMPLYKMRDLGPATLYLGIEIGRLPDGRIKLSQTRYIEKTLERYGMADCNGVQLPLKKELDSTDDGLLSPEEQKEYQSLVGALNWTAVVTRPDLAYTLSRLSKHLSKPARIHKDAAKQTLRYLAGTKEYGLIYGCKTSDSNSAKLIGYTDSNFAADTDNRRSTSGFLFMLNNACIHWQSKQQSLVARSTHEAEYVGMAIASYEITYLRKLLADISHTPIHDIEPTLLYGDNLGAIATATNPDGDKTPRSKHIDIRYHITREALANGTLRLQYIRTNDMTADILTKALPIETHRKHRLGMGLDRG
jgi:Reverse transcriptase (RNA-dependent DNA polymerase)